MHQCDRNRPGGPSLSRRFLIGGVLDPLLLALVCTCFFWKLVLTNQYTWLESPDLAYQVLPWMQFQAAEWHAGRFPLWDPYHWAGQPLVGQAQPGAVYPFNWLLFLLPLRDGSLKFGYLHWYYVFMHWMAAVFCYWLCRDLKLSRLSSMFGGLLFALSGYMGTTGWPQMLNGALWAPLVFLFQLRALRGRMPVSSAVLSGVFLGFGWLAGHHQVPIFVTLVTAAIWIWSILKQDSDKQSDTGNYSSFTSWFSERRRRMAMLAALAALFMFLTGAFQILPAQEYGKLAKRWVGADAPVSWNEKVPYSVHRHYSMPPTSLFGLVIPQWQQHTVGFCGLIGLTLAALATSLLWADFRIRLFTAMGAAGLLLALGDLSLIHGVLYSLVPMVEKARNPSTAVFLLNLAVAVLAAFGADQFRTRPSGVWPRRITLVTCVFGVIVVVLCSVLAIVRGPDHFGDQRVILTGFLALVFSGLLYAWRHSTIAPATLILLTTGFMLLEVSNVSTAHLPHRADKSRNVFLEPLRQHTDVAEFLRLQGLARVDVDDSVIPYNFGDWHGVPTYRGYLASVTENLLRLDFGHPKILNLLGIKYFVRKQPQSPDHQLIFSGQQGVNVYLNTDAFPRAWSVHEVIGVKTQAEASQTVLFPEVDLRKQAVIVGDAPQLEQCSGQDTISVVSMEPNRVVIDANMACRGMVILSDTWFPGWKGTVDGRPETVWEVDVALRGVVAGKGQHRIELVYAPLSVRLGGVLTLLAVLSGAALFVLDFRKQSVKLHRSGAAA